MSQATAHDRGLPSVMSDQAYNAQVDKVLARPEMGDDNIRLPAGMVATYSGISGLVGVIGLALTLVGAFVVNPTHALAAFEVGLFAVTGASLGCLALTMMFHAMGARWSATVRRTFENIASLLPMCLVGVLVCAIVELVGPGREGSGVLLLWMTEGLQDDYLRQHKAGFLNTTFFLVRLAVYAGIWTFLSWRMLSLSREQDRTGDRWITSTLRRTACWGLPVFALSLAFFAFDFLMAQDFRFFSTMWGVYYFAISALAGVSLVAVVLAKLRFFGRLTGVVTEEHFHDLGKLVFAFTCFWAYIAFSQYFLIWYSNIPEETMWYIYRLDHGWKTLFVVLAIGHFVVPFVLFVSRHPKRSTLGLGFFGLYSLVLTVLDLIFIIRPMVYTPAAVTIHGDQASPATWWLDAVAIFGVLGIYGFFLIRRLGSGPLVPTRDPHLPFALGHKNYV